MQFSFTSGRFILDVGTRRWANTLRGHFTFQFECQLAVPTQCWTRHETLYGHHFVRPSVWSSCSPAAGSFCVLGPEFFGQCI